jgi:hypothetical protein
VHVLLLLLGVLVLLLHVRVQAAPTILSCIGRIPMQAVCSEPLPVVGSSDGRVGRCSARVILLLVLSRLLLLLLLRCRQAAAIVLLQVTTAPVHPVCWHQAC